MSIFWQGKNCLVTGGAGFGELCSKVVYGRVTTGLNEVAYCCYKGFPTQRAT